MTSHNTHSSKLLRVGVGSWATTKTIVYLSIIQITVLSRLFADAIFSWVRNTMLIFGKTALQQCAHIQFHDLSKLFYLKHRLEAFFLQPLISVFSKVAILCVPIAYFIRPRSKHSKQAVAETMRLVIINQT